MVSNTKEKNVELSQIVSRIYHQLKTWEMSLFFHILREHNKVVDKHANNACARP